MLCKRYLGMCRCPAWGLCSVLSLCRLSWEASGHAANAPTSLQQKQRLVGPGLGTCATTDWTLMRA